MRYFTKKQLVQFDERDVEGAKVSNKNEYVQKYQTNNDSSDPQSVGNDFGCNAKAKKLKLLVSVFAKI